MLFTASHQLETKFLAHVASPMLACSDIQKQTFISSPARAAQSLFSEYSLKNFQVCVVVYCLIIKVLFCFHSLATAILEYHIFVSLSTTFFIFLKVVCDVFACLTSA